MQAQDKVAAPAADLASGPFEIFLAVTPGLEPALLDEVRGLGFRARPVAGGVTFMGGWPDVWRANLMVRGASRIGARLDQFRALHLAQLDKRARRVAWRSLLKPGVPFQVEATCRASRIYHSGAAEERVERAIRDVMGETASDAAPVTVRVRIEDDLCTLSVDTSGELLHKRGFKEAVAKAPMRESMAALFLRQCGYTGTEPVVDPMCGSGTFVIEAAEMALGLAPGRARSFAFEQLATFDPAAWQRMRADVKPRPAPGFSFLGSDRDAGAVRMSEANAKRAGVAEVTAFRQLEIDEARPPEGPPGLVMVNPPYGDRIGDKGRLTALYRNLGQTMRTRFKGWRVGIITNEAGLAKATGLPFKPTAAPVSHGGLRVTLYRTDALP